MFITIEGMDGSGKTTALQRVKQYLEDLNYKVVMTREPGGLPLSEKIRELILNKDGVGMEPWTEALLFIAARKEHLEKVIKPYLKKGYIVISDRFMDSTTAYQGGARGLGVDYLNELQKNILEGFLPDLTLYFELSFEDAEKRLSARPEEKNRLDEEGRKFKEAVKLAFEELVVKEPNRITVIDASKSPEEVFEETKKVILEKIELWKKEKR
ncbi:thymidylate kinase [Mesoplasma florum L1]|uniref:Thymidylate kinase n=1 Tax=Mesoplasma florum (strain ATCC 33453 / NBRC 100688 / NCTC 11704 / L1) TaxID=265311 RepID=KTHY_MESFL|nr:dTMP kinase [Mesoplasma florum]Q6F0E1.1 RecName: Full=Thymidylate kinase; AltName: Full=dTMP kinase [Mesoplasma florum L1]AAT76032.1 thymidylate kinase [Mesoplasma florum L1]ATI73630.1 thymidylate kinase [Mesoplasma florum]ATI74322.1 thymidylate kinase [Mesoplasma florum]AVN62023.1 thymidylate kinase [Mesoplasma florum]AVN65387.1 thymidylate kinase [Mesoplasma florum]